MPASNSRIALLALLAGAVGISFAPIFVRLSDVGPSATAFYRVFLALPVLWLMQRREQGQPNPPALPTTRGQKRLLVIAGLLFAGDMAFWHWSIKMTSIANSTLLANFAPIFVTLGAWLLLGEHIKPMFIVALIVTLFGAAMLVGASLRLDTRHLIGDGLGLVTALFYAGYQLCVKRLRDAFSSTTILAWSGLSCAASLFIVSIASGESLLPSGVNTWLVLAGLALISHVGGQGLIAYAFGHLPASMGSISLLLQPLVAALLAWLLFSEAISPLQGFGGFVMLTGLFIAHRSKAASRQKEDTEQPAA